MKLWATLAFLWPILFLFVAMSRMAQSEAFVSIDDVVVMSGEKVPDLSPLRNATMVVGSERFKRRVVEAITLLPEWGQFHIKRNVPLIEEGGVVPSAWLIERRLSIPSRYVDAPISHMQGILIHETYHLWQTAYYPNGPWDWDRATVWEILALEQLGADQEWIAHRRNYKHSN